MSSATPGATKWSRERLLYLAAGIVVCLVGVVLMILG